MNAGATFQRNVDIAFSEQRGRFSGIYLDDIAIYSKSDQDHLKHLQ